MGYIAPVNHADYQQYTQRDHLPGYNPFYLAPVQKIPPYHDSLKRFHNEDETVQEFKQRQRKSSEQVLSSITGKGYYVNEKI
ncbi:hypothetical protein [Jeotgalibacillus proteolyticus]|uniref:Uncharacterized protein n=1 Tax=Jeotgalibacillus proteolyticus TaxID=2082395 RepID=A0A2S5GHD3_9BACL|nr:hypothetical protein [Jeotgalibacillus proteolyticus]PPA72305.1 hypothetical protein C4B60_02715 [Jeotgalibacillus proteolyticus]